MSTYTVLLAEDDDTIRDMLAFMLESNGYHADLACDGEEALVKATTRHYDVIILDHMMPQQTGFDVAQKLHARGAPRPPMIMITGGIVPDRARQLFDVVITKPFAADVLLEVVRRLRP